jgi:NADH dehydrogenase FAD-containing subunit
VGQESVFAIGDVAAADRKMASIATRQAQLAADNIRVLIAGEGELTSYEPSPLSIIVPIGPEGGSGQRAGSDDLLPAEFIAQAKGRDMMIDRFAELLGVVGPG